MDIVYHHTLHMPYKLYLVKAYIVITFRSINGIQQKEKQYLGWFLLIVSLLDFRVT